MAQFQFGTNMSDSLLKDLLSFIAQDESILSNQPEKRKALLEFVKEKPAPTSEYLTRSQVAKLLQISLPTLHDYTKRGELISYRIGFKVRYKASEVDEALKRRNFTFQRLGGKHGA